MKFLRSIAAFSVATAATVSLLGTAVAPAAGAAEKTPAQISNGTALADVHFGATPDISPVWREKLDNDRLVEAWAHSPSMNRNIPMVVLKASSPNRPTVYLLNGGDGGEGRANWVMQTDAMNFYKEKDVNVVVPMAGKFSYYTDWVSENASLGGKQKWETFLTKELPGPMESMLKANNKRAIVGMSMSATSSLLLAEHAKGFYDAVGSFSGCAATSTPMAYQFLRLTLQRGNATPEQMWGPMGSDYNRYNDAVVMAEDLRGTEIYVSNASGVAGGHDTLANPRYAGLDPAVASASLTAVVVEGGLIEAGTNMCTNDLKVRLKSLNIPADFNMRNTGTHSWSYWQDDLRASWPTFERAFNK
ncbi:alpha/beta hydrolase [Corynebacterium ulcerans]|uniref:alpha/beta hydrolase n=1 Tax=Corynebacterium ulcerans TaxID=65058 RepID=UPI000DA32732|nr:alpha/beta hydrolase family protein [Corynebacterium ulcerans]SQG57288.1 Mycolyl transferase 85A [Corynebacterium ulcerans]